MKSLVTRPRPQRGARENVWKYLESTVSHLYWRYITKISGFLSSWWPAPSFGMMNGEANGKQNKHKKELSFSCWIPSRARTFAGPRTQRNHGLSSTSSLRVQGDRCCHSDSTAHRKRGPRVLERAEEGTGESVSWNQDGKEIKRSFTMDVWNALHTYLL